MLDKTRLSKRAIVRKLESKVSEKEIKNKFKAILEEKGINRKVSLTGKTRGLVGYLDKKIKITKKIGRKNAICSYVIFREESTVPLLKNVNRFNYGIVLLVEYQGHFYSYLEAFPNITKWLEDHTEAVGVAHLKKVFSGKVEFKKVSIRNPKPSMFEVSGISLDGYDIKSNVGVFGKERQVLQRVTSSDSKGSVTLDFNSDKVQVSGGRHGISDYLKWIGELSEGLRKKSSVKPVTNSFFDGFMKSIDDKELGSITPKGLYINESMVIDLFQDDEVTLTYRKKELSSDDISSVQNFFKEVNNLDDYSTPLELNAFDKKHLIEIKIEKPEKRSFFDVKFNKFPSISVERAGKKENLISSLMKNEGIGVSFDNKDIVQLGRKVFKSETLKKKAKGVSEILTSIKGLSETEFEKYGKKTEIKTSTKFPSKSVFSKTEAILKSQSGNKVFLDDLGNEWCDYLSYNLKEKEVQFVHCKFKKKPETKDYSVSASNFQDVFGQAQKNIGNILHGYNLIQKKFEGKFAGEYSGSKIKMDRSSSKLSHDKYVKQFEEIYHSPRKRLRVVIAINFISKRSFENDINNALYETDPYFWQQVYFIVSASEFYKQQGIDFEIWCGE